MEADLAVIIQKELEEDVEVHEELVVAANTVEELSKLLNGSDVFYGSVTPMSPCDDSLAESDLLDAVVQFENEVREGRRMEEEEERGRWFRDWQTWMDGVQRPRAGDVLEVSVRARVRHRGIAGKAHALRFQVRPGDTVEVAVAVDHAEQARRELCEDRVAA